MALYIIYNADGVHEPPVYGIFDSEMAAEEACETIVNLMVEECLAEDPIESGLDREIDEAWLRKECRNSLGIQVLDNGINKIHLSSEVLNYL